MNRLFAQAQYILLSTQAVERACLFLKGKNRACKMGPSTKQNVFFFFFFFPLVIFFVMPSGVLVTCHP